MLVTFDSVSEFVKANPKPGTTSKHGFHGRSVVNDRGDGAWTANLSFDKAMKTALAGDSSYVAGAEQYIDKVDAALPQTVNYETVRSPFGYRVNVGDWLAQSPTPMRRRLKRITEVSPIKIVVSLTSSAGIDADTMKRRGEAILAFLLKVQQIRPVDLYTLIELDGETDGSQYLMIRQESRPLNISQAAFCLCNVGFARHGYNYADLDGFLGSWPAGYYANSNEYATMRRERLGLNPQDIVIKEAYMTDPIITNPELWIKTELAKISNQTEEEN
jgi:hypothetical protein